MKNKYDFNLSLENAIKYLQLDTTTNKQSEILFSIMWVSLLEEYLQEITADIKKQIDTENKKTKKLSKDYPI